MSACAGNGGVCSAAAGMPPQFRDLSIAQAGATWDITKSCSSDRGAEGDTPGYDSSVSSSRRKTARLDRGRTPRCASTPVTSSPQHGSSRREGWGKRRYKHERTRTSGRGKGSKWHGKRGRNGRAGETFAERVIRSMTWGKAHKRIPGGRENIEPPRARPTRT